MRAAELEVHFGGRTVLAADARGGLAHGCLGMKVVAFPVDDADGRDDVGGGGRGDRPRPGHERAGEQRRVVGGGSAVLCVYVYVYVYNPNRERKKGFQIGNPNTWDTMIPGIKPRPTIQRQAQEVLFG